MWLIITGLYRWGAEKNRAEHFSVDPRPWCLFTRFSPCQYEKAPFTGKQHALAALLQMTHILKARLFECPDMWHRRQAPRTQCDTPWVKERPVFRGFVSSVCPAPDRLGWTGKAVVREGCFKAGNCIRWSERWDAIKGKGWMKNRGREDQGEERGTGWLLTPSCVSGGQPCLVPNPPPHPPLPLTYSAFSLPSLPPLASDFPKTLLRGRAVTITPFRSIQTFSERGSHRRREIKWEGD